MMNGPLSNFIKYCLGYIKLTKQKGFVTQQRHSVGLSTENINLIGLLNGDIDGNAGETIALPTFYKLDPTDVTEENSKIYEKEKELAVKIEELFNKFQNDQFTKQLVLNFGFFEIEVPIEVDEDEIEAEEIDEASGNGKEKIEKISYPLFSLPIRIEKENRKDGKEYVVYSTDPEIQVNTVILEPILGQDLYFQVVEEIGAYEMDSKLTLPITSIDIFSEIWHRLKAQLKLKEAKFNEKSFSLNKLQIALSPKSNFFLAEDLRKLAEMSEEEMKDTSLTSWISDDEINIETDVPQEKELYFPFLYDKYQLRSLSLLGNKASVIQGPPGTGKSETIANLLCHLSANGKRVLFVSQKAQALKVVKDKLKKLHIKYLFGYLPNPASKQLSEEDEIDGIAPQLSALSAHIEQLGYHFYPRKRLVQYTGGNAEQIPRLDEAVRFKQEAIKNFDTSVDDERKVFKLSQELDSLKEFACSVTSLKKFSENFGENDKDEISSNLKHGTELSAFTKSYQVSQDYLFFSDKFKDVNLHEKKYAAALLAIRDKVAKSGFDGHSKILRKFSNILLNIKLGNARSYLPREIRDYVDSILSSDSSRQQSTKEIERLFGYLKFFADSQELDELRKTTAEKLNQVGLSPAEFNLVNAICSKFGFKDSKTKILARIDIQKEFDKFLRENSDLNELKRQLSQAEKERKERVVGYIQNIINKNIIEKWREVTVKRLAMKLSKAFGKSKRAFKTFDKLRKDPENFNAVLDLIPVWIMELDDASRIIPLEAGVFDYVILDEASQCNIAYTLPAMFRSKRTLFVGDSEQMRDNTIMFKSNRFFDELAHRYQIPEDLRIKASGSAVQSVLDIAMLRGLNFIPLRYHYRSPWELIGFSNKYFYKPRGKELIALNSNYLTFGDSNRVMLIHEVKGDYKNEISDKINTVEAEAILDFFRELRSDPKYQDKSIGILTFFNDQAAYIRKLFEEVGLTEDEHNFKVSIVEGIQGDEKDIVLYSFVIRGTDKHNELMYRSLTGEGGDIRGDINRGRVNVAFSRARLQSHCFISLPTSEIPDKIWIKKYLEYVEKNGEVQYDGEELKPFDSYFEEEFYGIAKNKLKSFKIQNQYESCGFKIDFVISNPKNGKKIAVECDGPTHFADEIDEQYGIYVDSDEERQRVLEAAGWNFFRIKYSDWIKPGCDKNAILLELKGQLGSN